MPGTTLVRGGPASGKTRLAAEAVATAYAADPFSRVTVLVPTFRHADQFRRRVVAGGLAAFNLTVTTPSALAAEAVIEAGRAVAARSLVLALLGELLRHPSNDGSYFWPIRETRGVAALVEEPIAHLLAEQIDLHAFATAPPVRESPRLTAIATLALALEAELSTRQLVHRAAAPALAATVPVQPLALFVADGFRSLSVAERALLRALSASSESSVVTVDPVSPLAPALESDFPAATPHDLPAPAPTLDLRSGTSVDREQQFRDIAYDIKQRLAQDPTLRPSDVAVAVRQVGPYVRLARQVFAEFDLPLDVAAAEPLAHRPFGQWVLRLLSLPSGDWRLRDLLAVLRSGYCDTRAWNLGPGRLAIVAGLARRSRIWANLDSSPKLVAAAGSAEAADPARADPRGEAVQAFRSAVGDLKARLTFEPSTPEGYARALADWLFGRGGLVRRPRADDRGPAAEIQAFRQLLASLGAVTVPSEQLTLDEFVAVLAAEMERPTVQEREAGGVLVAPVHTLHGLGFRHVYAAGLVEGEFPVPRAREPFLRPSDLAALATAAVPIAAPPHATEDELWASVRSRAAESFTAWTTRLDERRRERAASGYFSEVASSGSAVPGISPEPADQASPRELALACVRAWTSATPLRPSAPSWLTVRTGAGVERLRRSFSTAAAFEGDLRDALPPELLIPAGPWSASRLETYQSCPFRFFGRYILQLSELEGELEEPDAAVRGSVIHEILESAIRPLADRGDPFNSTTLEEVVQRVADVSGPLWDSAPQRYGFGQVGLWRVQLPRTLEEIGLMLGREARAGDALKVTRVHGVEVDVTGTLPGAGLDFTGKVDRVDVGPDLAVIVDYKSSRAVPRAQIDTGRLLQLQLYGAMVQRQLGVSRVVGRYAATLAPDRDAWFLDSATSRAPYDAALAIASRVSAAVQSGAFDVAPRVKPCPSYCEMRTACRVNQFSRWKWQDLDPFSPGAGDD